MARTRKPKPPSRYSMDACIFEIASMRDRLGLQDKDIFLSIRMSQTAFSRKMAGARKFSVEELGRIADYFAQHTGRVLPGWPVLSDGTCQIIEARAYSADADATPAAPDIAR